MDIKGFKAQPQWSRGKCPYCYEKLGIQALWNKKTKKVYQCPKCHRIIDERFVCY